MPQSQNFLISRLQPQTKSTVTCTAKHLSSTYLFQVFMSDFNCATEMCASAWFLLHHLLQQKRCTGGALLLSIDVDDSVVVKGNIRHQIRRCDQLSGGARSSLAEVLKTGLQNHPIPARINLLMPIALLSNLEVQSKAEVRYFVHIPLLPYITEFFSLYEYPEVQNSKKSWHLLFLYTIPGMHT